jgi:hypothetical protein
LQGAEFGHGVVAGFGGAGWEIFFLHEVDVGQRGGAGDEIAPESRETVAGFEGGGDFGARGWPTFVLFSTWGTKPRLSLAPHRPCPSD